MNSSRVVTLGKLSALVIVALVPGACGESPADPAAAPAAATPSSATLVTVTASSEPAGAVVTGGGRMLGRTPLIAQVPIPSTSEAPTFEFTFQMPGYSPMTVQATPRNNTISVDATLTPLRPEGAPEPVAAPQEEAPPSPSRTLSEIVRGYQPSDASPRFVWAATNGDGSTVRVQLLCDERAVEAARRASQRFRRDATCADLECEMNSAGNSDPRLYAERGEAGVQLMGYWNALAGDASRARIEAWRRELSCSQILEAEL